MHNPTDDYIANDDMSYFLNDLNMDYHDEQILWDPSTQPNQNQQLAALIEIEERLKQLTSSHPWFDPATVIQSTPCGSGLIKLADDPLLDELKSIVASLTGILDHSEGAYSLQPPPYTKSFLQAFKSCSHLHKSIMDEPLPMTQSAAAQVVNDLNHRLWSWYQCLSLPSFGIEYARLKRNSRDNYRRFCRLADSLFGCCSRLLVVRIDLGYSETDGYYIDHETADYHRKKLCRMFHSHPMFEHLLGYAWKLEWRPKKGFHYHFVFFFDGNRVRRDIALGRSIGELWRRLTNNQGMYFNCNHSGGSNYLYNALGDIHYSDDLKREHLDKIAAYLTKVDEYVSLAVKGRTFQTSSTPRASEKRGGRPRLY
ncbi:YagK/YfjJ domain-containing protein [Kushneria konosiri]|nr:inovirus-type Gp2 protein [Kushneria konosiri]